MKKVNKKAFTLIELAIVFIIVGLFFATIFPSVKLYLYNSKIEATKQDLQIIKQSLISYASIKGYLPSDGNYSLETIPYVELALKEKDPFGQSFYYDVANDLISSDDQNICKLVSSFENKIDYPMVQDDDEVVKYSVAAVIISSGVDKILQESNSQGNRIYSSSFNRYSSTNDDIVVELTYYELLNSLCTFSDFNHTR